MLDALQAKPDPKRAPAPPPPTPSEVRELGEYRTAAPDGTIEVVKKRLVVYDAPVPCNTEANRAMAEERRKHRDTSGETADCFFTGAPRATTCKDSVRRGLEAQIAFKRDSDAQRKINEAQTAQAMLQEDAEKARFAQAADHRRASALRNDAKRALEDSIRRQRPTSAQGTGDSTSLKIGDGGAAAARTREINRATADSLRREVEQRQQRTEEARQERLREAVTESNRQRQAEVDQRNATRRAKVASQQKVSDELRRSRDEYRRQREVEAQREKDATASIITANINQLDARARREAEKRQQMKASYAETARHERAIREEHQARKEPQRIVTREETQVLLRCPKSGKLLPPSAFNIPQRQ